MKTIKLKCPKCKGTNIGQYRTPHGPIWCNNNKCGFRVENKEIENPFIYKELISIEENNKLVLDCYKRSFETTGIGCPDCGNELNYCGEILYSFPPQKRVFCDKCNYENTVFINLR